MKQELQTVESGKFSNGQIQLIKDTIAKGCSDGELGLFVQVCNKTGLDPFSRQIHMVKRGNTATIQTGIDGYRVIAERSGSYAGQDEPVFDFKSTGDHVPILSTVTVYRFMNGQRVGFSATAYYDEYVQLYNGKPGTMWAKMPKLMLSKCAEALALRKAFPNDLSGIYTHDEMGQADNGDNHDQPVPQATDKQIQLIRRLLKSSSIPADVKKKCEGVIDAGMSLPDASYWIDTIQGYIEDNKNGKKSKDTTPQEPPEDAVTDDPTIVLEEAERLESLCFDLDSKSDNEIVNKARAISALQFRLGSFRRTSKGQR